jgi:transketolase
MRKLIIPLRKIDFKKISKNFKKISKKNIKKISKKYQKNFKKKYQKNFKKKYQKNFKKNIKKISKKNIKKISKKNSLFFTRHVYKICSKRIICSGVREFGNSISNSTTKLPRMLSFFIPIFRISFLKLGLMTVELVLLFKHKF